MKKIRMNMVICTILQSCSAFFSFIFSGLRLSVKGTEKQRKKNIGANEWGPTKEDFVWLSISTNKEIFLHMLCFSHLFFHGFLGPMCPPFYSSQNVFLNTFVAFPYFSLLSVLINLYAHRLEILRQLNN